MSDRLSLPFDDTGHAHRETGNTQPPPGDRPLTVSELTSGVRQLLEHAFGSVVVEGEISNCRQWSSGHLYFTLKDDRAQLRAVMFRTTVRTLRFRPEDGMHVIVRGRLGVYDAKGEYQIVCDALEPHGLGALQAAFDQLKRRLQAEGLFEQARKRPLPVLPRRIGIVTSGDGAALRDILRVLTTRHPGARIVFRAARVQGEGAAEDLTRGLRAIAAVPDIDVVIVGRGGGSAEDLWAFNDERLARAIVACPVPVISAVGHEVDFTIADFVADVRAATPSNAAELVVERADHVYTRIGTAEHRLRAVMRLRMGREAHRTERLDVRLRHWPTAIVLCDRDCRELGRRLERTLRQRLARLDQRFVALGGRLERRDIRRLVPGLRARTVAAESRLRETITHCRLRAASRLGAATARHDALSPLAVLGRGYAVCWNDARDRIIRAASAVRPGEAVRVTLASGELACRVERTENV
jgi:exodeoxyribonuclease VII large subunit